MTQYYLKKLGSQELGYRKGKPGGGGRYIYVSKDCLEFFPPLSESVFNDSVFIPIIPPFSESKIYSKFVYHNDKKTKEGGTRDEYRLYLNKDVDPHGNYYKADDILVLEKYEEKSEGDVLPIYVLHRIEKGN